MNKLELGQKIRALRKERKQTLETLAEAADIGLVYLGEIERGIKMPSLKTFITRKCAGCFGGRADWFGNQIRSGLLYAKAL